MDPPEFWAVVDEAALRRVVGGPAVMSGQLDTIIEWAMRSNVHVQLLPFERGAHPALNSAFILTELGLTDVSDVVYVEGLLGKFYVERELDLQRYQQAFGQLWALSLGPQDTLQRISALRDEYRARH